LIAPKQHQPSRSLSNASHPSEHPLRPFDRDPVDVDGIAVRMTEALRRERAERAHQQEQAVLAHAPAACAQWTRSTTPTISYDK